MESHINNEINLSDITYMSELIPHHFLISYIYSLSFTYSIKWWGINSPKQLTFPPQDVGGSADALWRTLTFRKLWTH